MSEIRDILSVADLRAVEMLQRDVWGVEDRDIVPLNQLVAAREAGGLLIGAFEADRLVGFAYAFPGVLDGAVSCHSHLLAVRPGARRRSLGAQLKRAQRTRLLARGITRMTWTFDPLRTINAHLNFARLGVTADRYIVNFYGDDGDSPLHRAGTDRLWVTWRLDDPRVGARLDAPRDHSAQGETSRDGAAQDAAPAVALLRVGEDSTPQPVPLADAAAFASASASAASGSGSTSSSSSSSVPSVGSSADREHALLIELPESVADMANAELRWRWREATREAFASALAAGYIVDDFQRADANRPHGHYVLRRSDATPASAPSGSRAVTA